MTPTKTADATIVPAKPAARPTRISLWLPLRLIFLLLAPFALIAAPLVWIYPPARYVSPWRTVWALGAALLAIGGTEIDIHAPRALVHIRIRIV